MLAAFSGAMALGNLAFLLAKQQTMAEATSTLAYLPVLLLSLFALFQPEEVFLALFITGVALLGVLTAAFEGYRAKAVGLSTRDGRDLLIGALIALALGLMFLFPPPTPWGRAAKPGPSARSRLGFCGFVALASLDGLV